VFGITFPSINVINYYHTQRGTVPALKYSDKDVKETNITESAIVARFLAELKPSHLLPSANTSVSAVTRSRLAFFQDTWDTKIASHFYPTMLAAEADKEAKVKEWLGAIEKEIEPLLHDATPFFGGSQQLTMAEVHTGPFISRFHALSDGELIPVSLKQGLDALPNFGKWSRAVREHDIVKSTWDEPGVVASTKARINKMKADRK